MLKMTRFHVLHTSRYLFYHFMNQIITFLTYYLFQYMVKLAGDSDTKENVLDGFKTLSDHKPVIQREELERIMSKESVEVREPLFHFAIFSFFTFHPCFFLLIFFSHCFVLSLINLCCSSSIRPSSPWMVVMTMLVGWRRFSRVKRLKAE